MPNEYRRIGYQVWILNEDSTITSGGVWDSRQDAQDYVAESIYEGTIDPQQVVTLMECEIINPT